MIPLQTPPAIQAPASADRELSFPGFNGVTLKGSVHVAQGSAYFAVMVAGSGPTDRDWSNPLIPFPSHGGRDFAAWLASQGVASLRYDKRFIGTKDPKLDISLDAQVGDIKAAIQAARALPEAKGRKLLLAGHSEGALLSLLAASDADALLLIGLPPEPMGALIEAQVGRQLEAAPEAARKANADYLHAVLEAIRHTAAAPVPGEQVYPGLARLGQSLLAPESLSFVRGTLDLDPWKLASRCPVPLAVAYGEEDMQSFPPLKAPEDFHGAFIRIPQANHLLKREMRPASDLSAPQAMSAYGDDTPLADLATLAAWLKQLK
ncbi:MAG TPA: alpha/beta fold hydrolase [Holophagaceae bacterium]|nr:alpha/beta fold hydrolase [Holophagaceae bacterium]